MNITKITCDACEADITETGASPKYRLHLFAKMLPFTEDYRHAILAHPPLSREHHFCNARCLKAWVNQKVPQ